ncbi:MAG: hypothetical protein PHH84_04795 [Oscillospiraceae bacterium]|nr:hypothetical protein [Oscillospiraceae bacterium]MDD4414518.1 hypothetical protein [Oscillospiraceae bacterium]
MRNSIIIVVQLFIKVAIYKGYRHYLTIWATLMSSASCFLCLPVRLTK